MNVVATWMYTTPHGDKVLHSQVGRDSDTQAVQNYYWRCVICLFESSRRLNRDARHLLFVNKRPPPTIDGVDIARCIDKLGIEIVELGHWSRPPRGYYREWNTQFITLDVLDWLASRVDEDDVVLVLDSDCVFHRPIDQEFLSAVRSHGALLMSLEYPPGTPINGLTREELEDLSREYDPSLDPSKPYVYSGGEFICATGKEIRRIAPLARSTYDASLERHARGQRKFCEEAHLLSFVYQSLGYTTHTGNRFIKRIWTDRSLFPNMDGSEDSLTIWHLPSEKKRGFLRVFRRIREVDGEMRVDVDDFEVVFGLREDFARRVDRIARGLARPMFRIWKQRRVRGE